MASTTGAGPATWGVSVSGAATVDVVFPPEPLTAGRARRTVREALEASGATHLRDVAELVVSEVVTNAVVHAGTPITVRVAAEPDAVRVEVEDGSLRMPSRREWADTAGTGRGLRIVDEHADRWGSDRTAGGKVVWFEVGMPTVPVLRRPSAPDLPSREVQIEITLVAMPLLMHRAWQEHAATLLREYLLYAVGRDARALDDHAAASSALSVLDEQVPRPRLPAEPDALMASSVEPAVTADAVSLSITASSVRQFEVLDDLLVRAKAAAEGGLLLSPPTQPEMAEMRAWLCGEVAGQAGTADPTPWRARTDVRVARVTDAARPRVFRDLSRADEPSIAMDDTSVIVAATPEAVDFLGYRREADLLGRRILAVVPPRYHQAHIAGTTLHVTHGRDVLLNQWITVPMLRADGSEVEVDLHVESRRLDGDVRVFVAHLRW